MLRAIVVHFWMLLCSASRVASLIDINSEIVAPSENGRAVPRYALVRCINSIGLTEPPYQVVMEEKMPSNAHSI